MVGNVLESFGAVDDVAGGAGEGQADADDRHSAAVAASCLGRQSCTGCFLGSQGRLELAIEAVDFLRQESHGCIQCGYGLSERLSDRRGVQACLRAGRCLAYVCFWGDSLVAGVGIMRCHYVFVRVWWF